MQNESPLFKEYTLNITKVRKVKTPSKSYDAAGFDFYIPEDLSIWNFANKTEMFLNENINVDKNIPYVVPLKFYLTSPKTNGEFVARIVLKWNQITGRFVTNICADEDLNTSLGVNFKEITDDIIAWTLDVDTIISKVEMLPGSKICLPCGIHVNLPSNVLLKAENKSGIASKRGLIFGASVIDVDYQGEVHINMINPTSNNVFIKAGEKIIQYLPMFQPMMHEVIEYKSIEELYKNTISERGADGFGSTDKK